jgi:hypothetical protein
MPQLQRPFDRLQRRDAPRWRRVILRRLPWAESQRRPGTCLLVLPSVAGPRGSGRRFPWIDERQAGNGEVANVACHHREIVDQRSGGEHGIDRVELPMGGPSGRRRPDRPAGCVRQTTRAARRRATGRAGSCACQLRGDRCHCGSRPSKERSHGDSSPRCPSRGRVESKAASEGAWRAAVRARPSVGTP